MALIKLVDLVISKRTVIMKIMLILQAHVQFPLHFVTQEHIPTRPLLISSVSCRQFQC